MEEKDLLPISQIRQQIKMHFLKKKVQIQNEIEQWTSQPLTLGKGLAAMSSFSVIILLVIIQIMGDLWQSPPPMIGMHESAQLTRLPKAAVEITQEQFPAPFEKTEEVTEEPTAEVTEKPIPQPKVPEKAVEKKEPPAKVKVVKPKPKKRVIKKKSPPKNPKVVIPTNEGAVANYIERFWKTAQQEQEKFNIPASITLAQALLESAVGTSLLATKHNNHFGIKCFSKKCRKGHCVNFKDDSHKDYFVHFKSAWFSFRMHSRVLLKDRYQKRIKGSMDYKVWAKCLQEAGYATDKKYAEKLIGVIETYNLAQYDVYTGEVSRTYTATASK